MANSRNPWAAYFYSRFYFSREYSGMDTIGVEITEFSLNLTYPFLPLLTQPEPWVRRKQLLQKWS